MKTEEKIKLLSDTIEEYNGELQGNFPLVYIKVPCCPRRWLMNEIRTIIEAEKQEMKREMEKRMWKGANKWAEMMVRNGELKIGDDKMIKGEKVFGWTGEEEIASSIVGYIKSDIIR